MLFKPNGITSHSKCPSRQEKVVQGILSGCILTCQKPDLKSNLLNIVQSFIFPNKYSFVAMTPQTRGSVDYPSTHGIQVDVGLPDATSKNRAESPLYGELYLKTSPV